MSPAPPEGRRSRPPHFRRTLRYRLARSAIQVALADDVRALLGIVECRQFEASS